ncbi:MFS transporter [Nocardioides abyssi]|uniref:YbfB/YjiJ family MFS transporter n=1 Tax=Nocardioides abyssi TaxID=3058370 RepID=A0ABT8EQK3_9ACTN|nr:MFS transporter [Nocardioides abyssi]MDN4160430.1 YbfB/YjiJ family MFS transporter [Nocardioides abyssi]
MKRSFSFGSARDTALVVLGTGLIAGTYGLVRLAYGLFLPDIERSVPLGSALAGYVSSGASAAYCLGALVGVVAARHPRLLVAAAFATAAGGALGMAAAPGTGLLVPSVVLASTGAGLASPAMVGVVARSLARDDVDRGQAVVNSGTGPGLVGAGVLALAVPDWRAGFVVSAVLTAAAGVAVLLLDRGPGAAPETDASGTSAPRRTSPGGRTWMTALGWPLLGALLLGVASAPVWTYGRSHLVASGAGDTGSVLAWIALGAGGAATVLTAGTLSARPPTRAWALTTLVVAASVAALTAPGRLPAAGLACAVFGWSFVAATSALIAWVTEVDGDRAAAGTSAVFVALVMGQAAGSAAAGAVADGAGLGVAFVGGGVAAVGAAAVGAARSHREPGDRPDGGSGAAASPRPAPAGARPDRP